MKLTYDPTAKAEALARLLGALRDEAQSIEQTICAYPLNDEAREIAWNVRFRHVKAEIAYLEIIEAEWRESLEAIHAQKIDPALDVDNATIWHLGPENENPLASIPKPETLQCGPEENPPGTPLAEKILQSESGLKAQEIVDRAKEEREG